MLEAMSFGLTCTSGSQSSIGDDAFFMGVVAGGAGNYSLLAQGQQDAVLGFHVFYCRQYLIGWFAKVFGMKDLSGLHGMASCAEGVHISDEFGILEACKFFIGYFSVAV